MGTKTGVKNTSMWKQRSHAGIGGAGEWQRTHAETSAKKPNTTKEIKVEGVSGRADTTDKRVRKDTLESACRATPAKEPQTFLRTG